MQKTIINGVELAYTHQLPQHGQGAQETIVMIHCGFIANGSLPLLREPALAEYEIIHYHRRGYGESARTNGVVPFEQQAADCLALMDYLGIERAHLVGHSIGGCIAIQAALSTPARVASLALLEPALAFASSPLSQATFGQVVGAAYGCYTAGDAEGAVETWLSVPFGPGYRAILERMVPGATKQMVLDAAAVFESEAPALQSWPIGADDLRRISQPVLSIYHQHPGLGFFEEVHQRLVKLLPQTESYLVPNVTHLLHLQEPSAVGGHLANFIASHAPARQPA